MVRGVTVAVREADDGAREAADAGERLRPDRCDWRRRSERDERGIAPPDSERPIGDRGQGPSGSAPGAGDQAGTVPAKCSAVSGREVGDRFSRVVPSED